MNRGIQSIIYPVKDVAQAKALYTKLYGLEPHSDHPFYVGYKIGDLEIGLDPNGHKSGMTGPVGFYHFDDIKKALQDLLDAGWQTVQDVKRVGGGTQIATAKDADGNLVGLIQSD